MANKSLWARNHAWLPSDGIVVGTENRETETFYKIQYKRNLLSTVFSFSVPSSFLSSLFLSLPGASAIGKDEWNTNSFPAHSEACVKIAPYKNYCCMVCMPHRIHNKLISLLNCHNSPFQAIIPIKWTSYSY
jgi:hypothetical protein